MKERMKKSIGSPQPLLWSARAGTAIVTVGCSTIKEREILNRPPTEVRIRGAGSGVPVSHRTPIIEVA
ncbi:hypothetical protein J2129_002746 [Methanofollis sp. W23]|nr:hypothetical protein [Methanofollis sp. W23]